MRPSLGFITNPLVRHSAERDPEALSRHAGDARTAHVVIAGDSPILRAGTPGTALLGSSELARIPDRHEQVFLGTLDERPVVATLVAPEAADPFR
jgi:NAD+ diphosphatase